jgi:galactokinase
VRLQRLTFPTFPVANLQEWARPLQRAVTNFQRVLSMGSGAPPAVALTKQQQRATETERVLRAEFPSEAPVFHLRAPGRVNLIGEYLDMNQCFVFPAAIDRAFVGSFQKREDDRIVLRSLNQEAAVDFSLKDLGGASEKGWGSYIKAVAQALQARGAKLTGLQGVIDSDVPVGSGLSSSAALELLIARAMTKAAGIELSNEALVRIAYEAEHDFVGVKCGIMDQYASGMGKKGCGLLIDCRSVDHKAIRLDLRGYKLVVADTSKQRSLVDSKFNERCEEFEEARHMLSELAGEPFAALRDVEPAVFEQLKVLMPETLQKRAQHVIDENQRVLDAVEILQRDRKNGMKAFGALLDASHRSLRDLLEVSCPELDEMVRISREHPGAIGSRMTGAGFGGCTLTLVKEELVDDFVKDVAAAYHKSTGLEPKMHVVTLDQGASDLDPPTPSKAWARYAQDRSAVARGELSKDSAVFKGAIEPAGEIPTLATGARADELRKLGERALASGKVAVVVLNGGMATRFGGVVKGTVDVFDRKSFLELKADDVRKASEKYGAKIPLVLMNSFATRDATLEHVRERNGLGLAPDQILTFDQSISIRMNPDGSTFRGDDGLPSYHAPGHGDFFRCIRDSGVLKELRDRGVETILFSNVDNLGATIDPLIIGQHLAAGVDMTAELVERRRTASGKWDQGASVVKSDDMIQLVEGFRLPELPVETFPDFSTNNFLFSAKALDQDVPLERYVVEKKVDGRPALQLESITCEATGVRKADGSPLLSFQPLRVPRDGKDGRFFPIKEPADLEASREELRARLS